MFNLNLEIENLIYQGISKGGKVLFILLLLIIFRKIGQIFISKSLNSRISSLRKGREKNKERKNTLKGVLTSILNVTIFIVGVLTILPELGINITPLLAGAGVVGLAISMGASNLVKDYISGFFILIEDQYRVGEKVEIAGAKGVVKDFDLRRTLLEDEQGKVHFIPNGQIDKTTNSSR